MRFPCNKTWVAVLLAGGILAAPAAFANAVRFDFGPVGTPSMTALFEDVAPNQVQLTVTALNLSGNNSVNSLYFNFNPTLDSKDLNITQIGSIGGAQGIAGTGNDSYKAIGGGGKYDLILTFGPNPTFMNGNVATFSITGFAGLSVSDFLFQETAAAGRRPTYAVGSLQELSGLVIIQGTPTPTDIPNAPDTASTLGLFVMGLLGLGWLARRFRASART